MTTLAAPVAALQRPRDAWAAGVAASLAAHLGWSVGALRALFVALTPVGLIGPMFYLWLWLFTPRQDGQALIVRRMPVAGLLVSAGALFTVLQLGSTTDRDGGDIASQWMIFSVLGLAATAAGGIWSGVLDRTDPLRGPRRDVLLRSIATVIAVLLGMFAVAHAMGLPSIFGYRDNRGADTETAALALLSVLTIVVLWTSALLARIHELQSARVLAIREEQRASMAAHLHDSVLQTLALIQNRAGPSSEVGRIARAQERELRAWLFDGDSPADSDLAADLRDYAVALELDYGAAITVVAAGSSTERASGEVAAAAREAMLNAARHAGGEVSVYIEGSPGLVEVFVRDRGPGFDPLVVPEDRLGVRESIIGRMRRIGGRATVTSSDAGVQVHIRYPAEVGRA